EALPRDRNAAGLDGYAPAQAHLGPGHLPLLRRLRGETAAGAGKVPGQAASALRGRTPITCAKSFPRPGKMAPGHEPLPSALLAELNEPLTVVPRFFTIVTQAVMIIASITAYSTAVGPSSLTTK